MNSPCAKKGGMFFLYNGRNDLAFNVIKAFLSEVAKGGDTTPGRTTWIQNPIGLRYDSQGRPGWNIPRQDWFNQI